MAEIKVETAVAAAAEAAARFLQHWRSGEAIFLHEVVLRPTESFLGKFGT